MSFLGKSSLIARVSFCGFLWIFVDFGSVLGSGLRAAARAGGELWYACAVCDHKSHKGIPAPAGGVLARGLV